MKFPEPTVQLFRFKKERKKRQWFILPNCGSGFFRAPEEPAPDRLRGLSPATRDASPARGSANAER